ncbi:MAG: hypothetical protein ACK4KT_00465 [Thermaurantimonas sp.]
MRRLCSYLIVLLPLASGWMYLSCQKFRSEPSVEDIGSLFWSMGDTLRYVGINVCKDCHYDIFSTYIHTGMGSSFGIADTSKSAIPLQGVSPVYDPNTQFYYLPFFDKNRLKLLEFKLRGEDTIYRNLKEITYIIGSGHHTNSHLINCDGYLFQAPITYYTQTKRPDLPPGFENGHNTRFSRPIGIECMSCHNAMPLGFTAGSENRFDSLPLGIDCERCHGPGSGHVAKILRGDITDTARTPDYSIVNPRRLPVKLRFELCQRCHLQGNAVLADGKSFLDFRPGMMLKDVMDVYLPRYENDEHFIMASHADRLSQSTCFKSSKNSMECTTCHNPHISSRNLGDEFFNEKCRSCHNLTACREKPSIRRVLADNCVTCHMPVSGSIDIPHVTIHDHKIGVHKKLDPKQKREKITALVAINNPSPSIRSKVQAYLQQYEGFEPLQWYLDSARALLASGKRRSFLKEWVHYIYLSGDLPAFKSLYPLILEVKDSAAYNTPSLKNENAWFWYRTAHLAGKVYGVKSALPHHIKSVELAPYHYEFKIKYAVSLTKIGNIDEALRIFLDVNASIPHLYEVSGNVGYLYLVKKDFVNAEKYLLKSLEENPDYEMAYKNLIQLYLQTNADFKLEALKTKMRYLVPELYKKLSAFLK